MSSTLIVWVILDSVKVGSSKKSSSTIDLSFVLSIQKSAFGPSPLSLPGFPDVGAFALIFRSKSSPLNESAKKALGCSSIAFCISALFNLVFIWCFLTPWKLLTFAISKGRESRRSEVETIIPLTSISSGDFSRHFFTRMFANSAPALIDHLLACFFPSSKNLSLNSPFPNFRKLVWTSSSKILSKIFFYCHCLEYVIFVYKFIVGFWDWKGVVFG